MSAAALAVLYAKPIESTWHRLCFTQTMLYYAHIDDFYSSPIGSFDVFSLTYPGAKNVAQ